MPPTGKSAGQEVLSSLETGVAPRNGRTCRSKLIFDLIELMDQRTFTVRHIRFSGERTRIGRHEGEKQKRSARGMKSISGHCSSPVKHNRQRGAAGRFTRCQ